MNKKYVVIIVLFVVAVMLSFNNNCSSPSVEKTIEKMTLEEKVGQLFIGIVYGATLDDRTKKFLHQTKLGNIIYFNWANGLNSPEQVKKLSAQIKQQITTTTGIKPFICIDQEGGRVTRLKNGFAQSPGNGTIGDSWNINKAYQLAVTMGKEMKKAGINLNFAPVVDVNSNPNNPVIGDRSFSDNPDRVVKFANATINGYHKSGILATIKHFPGHGDTKANSHLKLPIVEKSREEIEKTELKPFKALQNLTDAIMTSHIIFTALDPNNPATTSKIILTDLLRKKWNYNKLIISDSLVMRGIAPNQNSFEETVESASNAAIKAFLAGCDLLIVSKPKWSDAKTTQEQDYELIGNVIEKFKEAAQNGEIPQEKINSSVKRILTAKKYIN